MAMTPEQAQRALAALKGKLRGACSVCGTNRWAIVDLASMLPFDPSGAVIIGQSVPVVLVACENCKHLLTFSAVALGVVGPAATTAPPTSPPASPQEPPDGQR